MNARWGRLVAVAGLTATLASVGTLAGVGTANAATPIVLGSCATSVRGAPGTPVELSPSAVVGPITTLVGPLLGGAFQSAFNALPPIPLGALPAGSGEISGASVANSVVAQLKTLPLLGPVMGTLAGSAQSTLTSLCGITETGINAVAAPIASAASTVASAASQVEQTLGLAPKPSPPTSTAPPTSTSGGGSAGGPGGSPGGSTGTPTPSLPTSDSPVVGGLPAGSGQLNWPIDLFGGSNALSPNAEYAGIPFASAGLFAPAPALRYGDTGSLAASSGTNPDTTNPDVIQTAGDAQALGGLGSGSGPISLPMLLAVLALSAVTAALVRTWALRRMASR